MARLLSRFSIASAVAVLGLLAVPMTASAQVVVGIPPFQSFGGEPDVINLGNLNVHYSIPVFSRSGRGIPFSYSLAYDSSIWSPGGTWLPNGNWGLTRDTAAQVGYAAYKFYQVSCRN